MKINNQRMQHVLSLLPTEEAKKLAIEWSEEWKKLEHEDELNYL